MRVDTSCLIPPTRFFGACNIHAEWLPERKIMFSHSIRFRNIPVIASPCRCHWFRALTSAVWGHQNASQQLQLSFAYLILNAKGNVDGLGCEMGDRMTTGCRRQAERCDGQQRMLLRCFFPHSIIHRDSIKRKTFEIGHKFAMSFSFSFDSVEVPVYICNATSPSMKT